MVRRWFSGFMAAAMLASVLSFGVSASAQETEAQEETAAETAVQTEAETEVSDGADPEAAEADQEAGDVNIMALKGPTAMGMVKFMSDADAGGDRYAELSVYHCRVRG